MCVTHKMSNAFREPKRMNICDFLFYIYTIDFFIYIYYIIKLYYLLYIYKYIFRKLKITCVHTFGPAKSFRCFMRYSSDKV